MTAALAPTTTTREHYRGTARTMRHNAGIGAADAAAGSIEAVADFGAAARRLRASVRGGEGAVPARRASAPTRQAGAREPRPDQSIDTERRLAILGSRSAELLAALDAEKVTGAPSRAAHPAGSARAARLDVAPVRPIRIARER